MVKQHPQSGAPRCHSKLQRSKVCHRRSRRCNEMQAGGLEWGEGHRPPGWDHRGPDDRGGGPLARQPRCPRDARPRFLRATQGAPRRPTARLRSEALDPQGGRVPGNGLGIREPRVCPMAIQPDRRQRLGDSEKQPGGTDCDLGRVCRNREGESLGQARNPNARR